MMTPSAPHHQEERDDRKADSPAETKHDQPASSTPEQEDEENKARREEAIDEALMMTFPASDPPSWTR